MYSFDIFDTCISRILIQPLDIFLELVIQFSHDCNLNLTNKELRTLIHNRIRAENIARSKSQKEDITITDIYEELSSISFRDIDLTHMRQLEIELEIANTYAIPQTLSIYNELKTSGNRTVFISDMYLPRTVLFEILHKCGFNVSKQDIYVSGEIGLTKRSGRLFEYVFSCESVQPDQVVHYGDNRRSDYQIPKRLGVKAVLFKDVHTLSRYEQRLSDIHPLPYKTVGWINRQTRLFRPFLTYKKTSHSVATELCVSKLVALMKATRLHASMLSNYDAPTTQISSGVAVPVIIAFVLWVFNEAKKRKITKLYFISRNGQIFHQVAQQLSKNFTHGMEFNYLYGSRSAWYPAAMYELDDYFFKLLKEKYSGSTIPQILKELKFNDDEISSILNNQAVGFNDIEKDTNSKKIASFFKKIRDSKLNQVFIDKFSLNRKTVLQYLSEEGFVNNGKKGIVDVGWHLSSHVALHRIINASGIMDFTGFYLGVDKIHETVPEGSPYLAFISNEKSNKNNWLFKLGAMTLLEDVFAAGDHGSVCGYQNDERRVKPVFSTKNYNYTDTVKKIQNDVITASKIAARLNFTSNMNKLSQKIIQQYYLFYKYPNQDEVRDIAKSTIFARVDQELDQQRVLARPLTNTELINIIKRTLFHKKDINPDWMWFEGSAAISSWSVRLLGRLLSLCNQVIERLEK